MTLKQELLKAKEKIAVNLTFCYEPKCSSSIWMLFHAQDLESLTQDLKSLLDEAKEDRKAIDREHEALITKVETYREQNKVYELHVDSLEKSNEVRLIPLFSVQLELFN